MSQAEEFRVKPASRSGFKRTSTVAIVAVIVGMLIFPAGPARADHWVDYAINMLDDAIHDAPSLTTELLVNSFPPHQQPDLRWKVIVNVASLCPASVPSRTCGDIHLIAYYRYFDEELSSWTTGTESKILPPSGGQEEVYLPYDALTYYFSATQEYCFIYCDTIRARDPSAEGGTYTTADGI